MKEEQMSEQLDLFETSNNIWVQRVWESVDLPLRHEVIFILAQMATAQLQAERIEKERAKKEKSNES
jgi:hypothetical protein